MKNEMYNVYNQQELYIKAREKASLASLSIAVNKHGSRRRLSFSNERLVVQRAWYKETVGALQLISTRVVV